MVKAGRKPELIVIAGPNGLMEQYISIPTRLLMTNSGIGTPGRLYFRQPTIALNGVSNVSAIK